MVFAWRRGVQQPWTNAGFNAGHLSVRHRTLRLAPRGNLVPRKGHCAAYKTLIYKLRHRDVLAWEGVYENPGSPIGVAVASLDGDNPPLQENGRHADAS
jgi:hypothetical protein